MRWLSLARHMQTSMGRRRWYLHREQRQRQTNNNTNIVKLKWDVACGRSILSKFEGTATSEARVGQMDIAAWVRLLQRECAAAGSNADKQTTICPYYAIVLCSGPNRGGGANACNCYSVAWYSKHSARYSRMHPTIYDGWDIISHPSQAIHD